MELKSEKSVVLTDEQNFRVFSQLPFGCHVNFKLQFLSKSFASPKFTKYFLVKVLSVVSYRKNEKNIFKLLKL